MKSILVLLFCGASLQAAAYEPPFVVVGSSQYKCIVRDESGVASDLDLVIIEDSGQAWASGKTGFYLFALLNQNRIRNSATVSAWLVKSFANAEDLLKNGNRPTALKHLMENLSTAEGTLLDGSYVQFMKDLKFPNIHVEIKSDKGKITHAIGLCR